ncbi:MAG: excinuclease ABC subunit UvrA [Candidatus Hodarchaeales archaeon]|jgi:excinuclease ABC subunit A
MSVIRDHIEVIGAKQNNLKKINVKIPRNKLTVITGVSGSGKSSLAFDVIFGEGQRLFLESLSTYARSRIMQVRRPDVEVIHGLSSVISIEQKQGIRNPRSTVGSLTDLSTYIRLLYSKIGEAHCCYCNKPVETKSINQIAESILSLPKGSVIQLYAPVFKIYNEKFRYLFDQLRRQNIGKLLINGKDYEIGDEIELNEHGEYEILAFIDEFEVKRDIHIELMKRLREVHRVGQGFLHFKVEGEDFDIESLNKHFKDGLCEKHHLLMGDLHHAYFSPNEPQSSCNTCAGLGIYRHAVPFLIVDDAKKSINNGAFLGSIFNIQHRFKYLVMYSMSKHYNFSLDTPFEKLPDDIIEKIFYGTKGERFELLQPPKMKQTYSNVGKKVVFEGLIPPINRWYKNNSKQRNARTMDEHIYFRGMLDITCPDCLGKKLKEQGLLVRINGLNIHKLGELSLKELEGFINEINITKKVQESTVIIEEIKKRLKLLLDIGLGYLNLNRRADSISAGEIQRVRLSTQIGSGLIGMLYILDEPSIGLHPVDNHRIISSVERIRDIGNTVIVVEHDTYMMQSADHIIDMGIGAGDHGGKIVAEGSIKEILKSKKSITGQYLTGKKKINIPKARRDSNGKFLTVKGAHENNLKYFNVNIPLGIFVCITGVSGSGKSTLINHILYKGYKARKDKRILPGAHDAIEGFDNIVDIRNIDQSPIGRNSRSNPATYVGFYDKIRKIFTDLPESVEKEIEKSAFSFNAKGSGRCEECEGLGEIVTSLTFMPDVKNLCPVCNGMKFNEEILELKYNGLNIAEVLDLSVTDALEFFKDVRLISHKLKVMDELGLGYLKLGQSATTLSGGEAQRIKLATEIGKLKKQSNSLYIFDEPSTGLHMDDIVKLLKSFEKLIIKGNSVLVVEHNLDIIKSADHIIDLGPEGGVDGGYIVAEGTPEKISEVKKSYTGQFLKDVIKPIEPTIK